jgi:hypothetical protein
MKGQDYNTLGGAFHTLMNLNYIVFTECRRTFLELTVHRCQRLRIMRKTADDASRRLFASGMQAAACILYTVAKLISCYCLERVGTEYHILFVVFAVGSICAVHCVGNICSSTGFVCTLFRNVSSS